jgi:uncharacterized membrane protein
LNNHFLGVSMKKYLTAYIGTAIGFCVLDFFWLTLVAPSFYQAQIGPLLLAEPDLAVALAFYGLFVAALVTFCVLPALSCASWLRAALLGAFFGLVAYATYDLTNLATLKGWTAALALVDMAWGSALSATASVCGYFFCHFFFRTSRSA